MAKRRKPTDEQPTKPQIVRANIERETITPEGFVSYYANDTQLQITPWDVRFVFGVIEEPPNAERKTIKVKSLGEVRMSPQHAKRVAMILVQQLKAYEEGIGPIPQPPD